MSVFFKDEKEMRVSEEALLSSGFSHTELQKIKNNVESYGGTLGEAIQDLAKRFIIAICVVSSCLAVFLFLVMFGTTESIFSGGIGLLCGIAIATFIQPPVLSYKSWRYCRTNKT